MDITLPWKEPNVFIFLLSKPEDEKLNSLFEEFLMNVLGVTSLSSGLTKNETKQLTVLKLSNEPFICYILVFIMDLNFTLPEDTEDNAVNESIQKFLSQPCFKRYGPVILSNLEDGDEPQRRKLEEEMGFYIYLNYEEYNDPKNIGIRLRKERIKKLKHLASL